MPEHDVHNVFPSLKSCILISVTQFSFPQISPVETIYQDVSNFEMPVWYFAGKNFGIQIMTPFLRWVYLIYSSAMFKKHLKKWLESVDVLSISTRIPRRKKIDILGEKIVKNTKIILSSFVPFKVNNPYSLNVRRIIRAQNVAIYPIKKVLKSPRLFYQTSIYNFNWFDTASSKKVFFLKITLLNILKLFGKKIIYTIHNKYPHNQKNTKYSKLLMKYMVKKSDAIVGLCAETRQVVAELDESSVSKLNIIPHPNYLFNYDISTGRSQRSRLGIKDSDLVILFLGFVSEYKNVDLLIECVQELDNSYVKLLIAGRPSSTEYASYLQDKAGRDPRIVFDFRYVPDEEITSYYATADLIVLPYHKTSSLNSGAVYLSLSLGTTVVCPDIGTVKDINHLGGDFLYDYSYQSESEHKMALMIALRRALADFKKDPTILKRKGLKGKEFVKVNNSDAQIGRLYHGLYSRLRD